MISQFTVVIERRALGQRVLALLTALAVACALMPARPAKASGAAANAAKISADLQQALDAPMSPKARWARDVNGQRQVQVVIMSAGTDPEMTSLRDEIRGAGGSVHVRMPGLGAVTATLPAAQVAKLAARSDVLRIAPNRPTARTASTLETVTGVLTTGVRSSSTKTSYSGLDGAGIGIAVLDSGVMKAHEAFNTTALNTSRVVRNVQMLSTTQANWLAGNDGSSSLQPGSSALTTYENGVAADTATTQDAYGHGTHVASIAAGRPATYSVAPDLTGLAPGASIIDVRVLDGNGLGTISDAMEGIQWAIFHAKDYNIRVLNLSLAANSTDSWQTDPLCAAVRSAAAAGITVVVAAGNFGKNLAGEEVYGTISAPGNDPSVITVGSANTKGTVARADDVVNAFSSRGPTRSAWIDTAGVKRIDNLLKPDLVAPGNAIVGAAATRAMSNSPTWNTLASQNYAALVTATGITQTYGETQMVLSGTSISAPAVAGTAALMLQQNPGLTPPLVKAILQYTAQPIPGASLLQQGAGLLNVHGAVRLAKALKTDIAAKVAAGTMTPGSALNATTLPAANSTVNNTTFNWSRIVFVGGNLVMSGDALFTKYQPFYDGRLTWANGVARLRTPAYWSGTGIAADSYVKSYTDVAAPNQTLVTAGVVNGTGLLGSSSLASRTGVFTPTATLANWFGVGSGSVLQQGVLTSNGVVVAEGVVISEGVVVAEGVVISEAIVISEGVIVSEGVVISEGIVVGEK